MYENTPEGAEFAVRHKSGGKTLEAGTVGRRRALPARVRYCAAYAHPVRRLVILIAVVLVNLPAVHQAWTDHRIEAQGRDVEAIVLDARTINGRHLVDYRLPDDVDPARNRFSASLDESTYEHARSSHRLAVRVIPGRPGANRPAGEVGSPILVVSAVAADVILLVIGALWLHRRRLPRSEEPTNGDSLG